MKIKVGDNVRVITGSNKGKEGKVLQILRKENKVIIDGINIVKKHVKPNRQNETGGIKVLDKKEQKAEKKAVKKETKKEEKEVKETKKKATSKKKEDKESK